MNNHWSIIHLDDIFTIARGGSPRPIQKFLTDDPNGVNWIMISDASKGSKYITATKKRIIPEGVKRSRMVNEGDFLLTNSMSFGKPYIMKTSGCIHDGWLVLSPKNKDIDLNYFYHLLGSELIYLEFTRRAAGATVKNLNINLVKGVEVPLPPLAEQKRIAAILDQADALRAKRRAALAKLDTLLQATFLDMFGDPVTNPMGWEVKKLGDICNFLNGGTPSRKVNKYFKGSIPWITSSDISEDDDVISKSRFLITQEAIEASATKIVPKNNILLVSRTGVGKVAITGVDICISQDFTGIIPNKSLVDIRCLFYFLRTRKSYFIYHQRGATIKGITRQVISELKVPLPPLGEQKRIATILNKINDLRIKHCIYLQKIDTLFHALQQRAFKGEL